MLCGPGQLMWCLLTQLQRYARICRRRPFLQGTFLHGKSPLVTSSLKAKHISDLNGATMYTTQGSGTEVLWFSYVKAHNWSVY
jgi:hypothetical protein